MGSLGPWPVGTEFPEPRTLKIRRYNRSFFSHILPCKESNS
jgi:hypothetical protein